MRTISSSLRQKRSEELLSLRPTLALNQTITPPLPSLDDQQRVLREDPNQRRVVRTTRTEDRNLDSLFRRSSSDSSVSSTRPLSSLKNLDSERSLCNYSLAHILFHPSLLFAFSHLDFPSFWFLVSIYCLGLCKQSTRTSELSFERTLFSLSLLSYQFQSCEMQNHHSLHFELSSIRDTLESRYFREVRPDIVRQEVE